MNRGLAESNRLLFVYRGDPSSDQPYFDCEPIANSRYRALQILNPILVLRLWRLVGAERADLLISHHIWSGVHGALLKCLTGKQLLFDNHNVEFIRFRRMSSPLWPLIWLLEWIVCRAADRVLCVSETDKERLIAHLHVRPDKIDIVPNGVDVESSSAKVVDVARTRESIGLAAQDPMALFFGILDYQPNAIASEIIVNEIAPRLEAQGSAINLIIAGRSRSREWLSGLENLSERVAFVGFVPDIVALIKSADLVVVPLTMGSGTRFKILESIGCGRRVVSTSIGAEGLNRSTLGASLIVRDDWDAFAQAIVDTAKQPPLPPSPAFVEAHDWKHIVSRLRI